MQLALVRITHLGDHLRTYTRELAKPMTEVVAEQLHVAEEDVLVTIIESDNTLKGRNLPDILVEVETEMNDAFRSFYEDKQRAITDRLVSELNGRSNQTKVIVLLKLIQMLHSSNVTEVQSA